MQHDHDQGLAHDLEELGKEATRQRRRIALAWLASAAGFGTMTLLGCGGGGGDTSSSTTTDSGTGSGTGTSTGGTTTTTTSSCSVIPEETNGPYPADGSNTANGSIANVLVQSGIVRSDIRSSFGGSSSTVAGGVPLTLNLKLVNASASCADLSGYAVYVWHCDREGRYSMYSSGVTNENYLRGVQVSASDGTLSFTTVFPACYSGRMPHIHVEVYASAATATAYTKALKTTQIAFPTDVCNTVYNNATGYSASIANFSRVSFSSDMVFSDGVTLEMATITGDLTNGYTAALTMAIAA